MNKVLVGTGAALLIALTGYLAWSDQLPIPQIIAPDKGYFTIGTINAEVKIPDGWAYVTNDDYAFSAFVSPDFKLSNGSNDPFGEYEGAGIVSGAVLIFPLFFFEEQEPLPLGTVVTLDGAEGDVASAQNEDFTPPLLFDRIRILSDDGIRYMIATFEYAADYPNRGAVLNDLVSSFRFLP